MPLPRPHPLARARLVTLLDRGLTKAWEHNWLPRISLDPDVLLHRASRGFDPRTLRMGRHQDDCADFELRLEKLCAAVRQEARLNAVGQACAHGLLSRAIKQRLSLGALWRKRPELPKTAIAPPIIVVGQMRSGTTRIHRLLTADPAHSATRFCDSWNPVPTRPDLRPLKGGFMLFMARKFDPWIDALHPFGAARADEELGWLASALNHCAYEAQWHIPAYVAFSEARDPAPIYREFARILRTDAGHHGTAAKPRILKVPQFAEDLPAILAQFPRARVVISRRSSAETLRSSISLVANQMAIQTDHADLNRIEAEWQRKIALRQQRMERALSAHHGPVAELDFDRLGADWRSEIRALYRTLGLVISAKTWSGMEREQARSKAAPHHTHAEQLVQFTQQP